MDKHNVNSETNVMTLDPNKIPHVLLEGEMGAVLEWKLTDNKTGKATASGQRRAESFVKQFPQLLMSLFQQTYLVGDAISIKDTGNTARDVRSRSPNFGADAGVGAVTHGIIVGTGSTAPTINDYVMETPIAHGTGAGQLSYGAVTWGTPAYDATTSQFTITRNFANSSGGTITINEIGLYVTAWDTAVKYFMVLRDKITGGIAVPTGQTLTVNYRLQGVI